MGNGADQRGGLLHHWLLRNLHAGERATFSSFSLQTFNLVREGAWAKALLNALLSVTLCFVAVGAGHLTAHTLVSRTAIAQTETEEGMEVS